MSWIYNGKQIKCLEDIPEEFKDYEGVIYCIVAHDGSSQEYIGQKRIWKLRKRIIGERELKTYTDKRKLRKYKSKKGKNKGNWVYYEEIKEDNGLINYCGSNERLLKEIKEGLQVTKYILKFVKKKSMLNYWEEKYLICEGVLEHPTKYYNDNIGGRFFKNNILKNL